MSDSDRLEVREKVQFHARTIGAAVQNGTLRMGVTVFSRSQIIAARPRTSVEFEAGIFERLEARKRKNVMSKTGNYIGGHTIITPRLGDYMSELERKAVRAKRGAIRAQREFDKGLALERERKLATIKELEVLNRRVNKVHGYRPPSPSRRRSTKGPPPKKSFVVEKIHRRTPAQSLRSKYESRQNGVINDSSQKRDGKRTQE